MNSRGRTCKIIFLLAAFSLFYLAADAATYYSRQNGNWNSRFTWSTSGHSGGAAASFPVAGDIVLIANHAVTVTADAFCTDLRFSAGYTTGNLTVNSGFILTVSGAVTLLSATNANTSFMLSGDGVIACGSVTSGTNINPGNTRTTILNISLNDLTVSGNISIYSNRSGSGLNNASVVIGSGYVTVNGSVITSNENASNNSSIILGNSSPVLSIAGATPFTISGTGTSTTSLNGTGATVNYSRDGAQNVLNTPYTNLTLSGSGAKAIPAGVSLSAMLSLEGTATASGSAPSYGTASAIRYRGSAAQTTGIELTSPFTGDGGLIIDNAAGVNLASSVTLSSVLNLAAGDFSVGANTLTLNGPSIIHTSGNLSTTTASSLVFGGSSPGIYIPASVASLNNLTINNTNGVTLNGNLSLASGGILTLSDGILFAGGYTVSVTNGSPFAVTGSENSFIELTTGGLQRTLTAGLAGEGSNYLFPIGEGGVYKAISLLDVNTGATGPVLKGSYSQTGALYGDGITIVSVDPACWTLQNTNGGNFTRARIELFEGSLDETKAIGMAPAQAGNYSTIGGTIGSSSIVSQPVINPGQYFALGTIRYNTFYSYMSGNWNDPFTWTSDPSGTLQIGSEVPGDDSRVIILTDRTVTLTQDVAQSGLSVKIAPGAFLDQAGYRFTSTLSALSGQGTLKLASANFPASTANTFVDAGGGTAEYYNSSNFTLPASQAVYNNLVINTSGATATQLTALTLNGSLRVSSGTFRINDNSSTAKLSLIVGGSVTVETGAAISVGNGVTNTAIGDTGGSAPYLNYYLNFHTVRIRGDFTNNGTVRFTNLTYPVYNAFPPTTPGVTSGAATVYFEGASDNTLTCNGVTDFYNLIVNKGSDQTYSLTVTSSAYSNFRLFGANDQEAESVTGNPLVRKALWIYAGTLVLKGNLFIPSLSEGSLPNAHYYIPSTGALICDGVDVAVFITADDYREVNTAYSVSASSNGAMGINTTGTGSSLYVFGRLQVNNGLLSAKESGGIVTTSLASGQVIINDGVVDAKQFLSSTGSASYGQSGGLFILRGRFQRTPAIYTTIAGLTDMTTGSLNTDRASSGISAAHGSFNLENPDNIYTVSGGTIRIYDVTTTATAEAFDVKSSPANINVTGGTLEIIPVSGSGTDATSYSIYSTAPLYNLTVNRTSGTAVVRMSTPLAIAANLSVISGVLNANSNDLAVGGNFLLETGTTYTTGTNTTTFNGSAARVFTVNLAAPLSLSSLAVTKPSGVALTIAGSQNTVNVSSALNLVAGTLNYGGKILNVSGNVFNSGIATGTGKIVLNGSTAQTINGGGVYGNLDLANTSVSPVSLLNRMTVNGSLNFAVSGNLNIGTYNLHLNDTASILNAGTDRFIQTAGNAGDGGLSRSYSSNDPFVFPVGMSGRYTPATIGFTASPAAYGSISVNPVDYEHPVTTVNGQSLSYYWRVKSAGFSGIPLYSVSHTFVYSQTDVAGTETNYVPALYDNVSLNWYIGQTSDINTATNTISDWVTPTNSTNFLDGDYTAGSAGSFGLPRIYYSRQNGLWSSTSTWSLTGHTVTNPPPATPGANDIVIIGGNDSIWLATENPPLPPDDNDIALPYYGRDKAVVNCASLQIEKGSVLDIQNNPGSTFASVLNHPSGNGKIRLTTRSSGDFDNPEYFVYPNGDFSEFSLNDGISEFYSINPEAGRYYILPSNADEYGTVIMTPLRGSNIILPNIPLVTINGDLICNGSDADAWLAMTWNGIYGTIAEKTVNVKGNLLVAGGSFGFIYNGTRLQRINIDGDVFVAPGAGIDVWSTSSNNIMSIGGSVYNNSDNTVPRPSGSPSVMRFLSGSNQCGVIFTGNRSTVVTNDPTLSTTPVTVFNNVTIDKGNSPDTTITWNIGGNLSTPVNNWLTLLNGSFVYDRTGDLAISTSTDFTIPATAGLTINTPSNVYISNAASSETLYLNGRLRILTGGGNVYIGPAGNTGNNADIEYSGSGASVLEVQSGNLFINGQIRRPLASTNGILTYRQSGGNVFIYGNSANAAKAKLEVLNDGSEFTMTGGNLTIIRGGGTTFGDLYLRPSSGSVTGGTVIFAQTPSSGPAIDADQSYQLDANIPLSNLTISGKTSGTNRNASLALMISPLVLNGNISLENGRSFLLSNNRNITIRGSLTNNGTYTYGTNRTIFDGGVQAISGSSVTDFYDLEVSSLTSLTANGDFTVNNDLDIVSGNLVLGSGLLTLRGNLGNNGAYTDDNSTGGIRLAGSSLQTLTGTGSFARLVLDTNTGARLNNDIALQHDLVMSRGVLDINKYQLTLSQNSVIHSTGFSSSNMIKSDGVASSRGLLKFFPTGAQTFTFPVGVAGKYTPALFTATASSTVGSVRINPVNDYHPTLLNPLNALAYYWQAESSGISGLNASLVFGYLTADVNGTESAYVAARLVMPGGTWDKAAPGAATDNVSEAANTVSFYYTGSNNLNGDYTAGNDAAIPDEVPEYITNSNGNWTDAAIWTPVGASPPCPSGGPGGCNVIIDHVVTADLNFISVLSTVLNGELRLVSPTYGHNLGDVTGNGKIYVEGGNLPGGTYTGFTDCSGNGTIEYGGSGTYIIVSGVYTSVPNLIFSGTGRRILPNSDLTVCKKLIIDGPILDNSVNNRKITVGGTFERYNSGEFRSGTGAYPAATVSFSGSSAQSFGGATGDFSGTDRLWNIEINNSAGLTISDGGLIEAASQLILTTGVINTSASGRLVLLSTSASAVVPVGGSSTSYVSGPLTKQIINGDSFVFPLGKGSVKGHRFTLTSAAGITTYFAAEFFSPNTTATSIAPPLEVTNTLEYWSVSSPAAASARIKIGWDPQSDLTPLVTENGLADMRVARYISGLWTEQPSTAVGTNNIGEVSTTGDVSVSATPSDFTTASISGTLARASFSSFTPICGSGGIPVSFISFTPITLTYILSYTINGISQPDVTVTSLPFTLPATVPGVYRLTGFRFNSGSGTGVVDANTVTVYELPPVSVAGSDQSLCGLSTTTLAGNNPGTYSGLWTVVSGAGGSFENSTLYNTVFNGVLGVSYTLRWTISNGPCSSQDEVVISFPVVASRPGDFTASETMVCPGGTGYVYTVPFVSGVTYSWSYSGTGQTIIGSGNSVTVDFSMAATGGTLSVTATNACGTSPARSVSITVRTASFAYPGSPYCQNGPDPMPVLDPGGVAGTFSSATGLVFISTSTGQIDVSASKSGTYIVTNTLDGSVCSGLSATATVTIAGQVWNGSVNSSWDNHANWSCGFVPYPVTDVLIPDVAVDPVIATGLTGEAGNLEIDPGGSLTISGGTMRVYGSASGSGSFDAASGTVEFLGDAPQSVISGLFTGNAVMNLTINNPAGVTLTAPLGVSGVVLVQNGTLVSDGNLTLLSDASGTALVDGSGNGSIAGDVTMQRYLPSAYGYKYFSSPFSDATVSEFGDDMNLASSFPLFYRYDENRTSSGWVGYTTGTNILAVMSGYAANFGSSGVAKTVDVTGEVNNGSLSVTLYNHNKAFTKGFNLVGNPYPSPIDWDAATGWTRSNVDYAVYYFRASTTDEYGGTYSSYVNGIPSDPGVSTNIIPSMQGFFVHVTDTFPATATLGMTNSVRISDRTHPFLKSSAASARFLLRVTAAFTDDTSSVDPLVVYFDDAAKTSFDSGFDALKLMNTDMMVTNFYSVLPGGQKLSINALPGQADTAMYVPLGLKSYRDGEVTFRMSDIENLPEGVRVFFRDAVTGRNIEFQPQAEYKVNLTAGDYNNRFMLAFQKSTTGIDGPEGSSELFTAYSVGDFVRATVWHIEDNQGIIMICDLSGRPALITTIHETGQYEIPVNVRPGLYVIRYTTGNRQYTKKLTIGIR